MRVFVDGRSVGSIAGRLTPNTLGPEELVEIKGDRHTISVNTLGVGLASEQSSSMI
jgi:hypothetical protein